MITTPPRELESAFVIRCRVRALLYQALNMKVIATIGTDQLNRNPDGPTADTMPMAVHTVCGSQENALRSPYQATLQSERPLVTVSATAIGTPIRPIRGRERTVSRGARSVSRETSIPA